MPSFLAIFTSTQWAWCSVHVFFFIFHLLWMEEISYSIRFDWIEFANWRKWNCDRVVIKYSHDSTNLRYEEQPNVCNFIEILCHRIYIFWANLRIREMWRNVTPKRNNHKTVLFHQFNFGLRVQLVAGYYLNQCPKINIYIWNRTYTLFSH